MVLESAFFWMGARRESQLYYDIDRHADIIVETVMTLNRAIRAYVEGKPDMENIARQVVELEEKGDVVFRETLTKIANSLLPSGEKQDMMNVLIHMEKLAEYAERIAKILILAKNLDLPEEVKKCLKEMSEKAKGCVAEVGLVVEEHKDMDQILKHSAVVIDMKNEAEEIKMKILSWVFEHQSLSVTQEFFLREIVQHLESITDSAEDCVDMLRILSIQI